MATQSISFAFFRQTRRGELPTGIAALLSFLLHLLLFVIALIILALGSSPPKLAPPTPEPIEIVLVEPPPVKTETRYLQTTEAQASETAPENPAFESDKNTRAASELPAETNSPLPSQEGVEENFVQFEDRENTLGESTQVTPPAPAQQETAQNEPAEQTKAEPIPAPTPRHDDLALLDPPVSRNTRARPSEEQKPQPPRPAESTYQPQTRTTRIRGGINNRGRAAADAVATPLGRYKKMLSDAIGSRWYYYVNQQMDLLAIGTVEIRFLVERDGTVRHMRILSNTSNESFAGLSMRSIADARIPPIPDDVAAALEGGRLEVDYSFTIISN